MGTPSSTLNGSVQLSYCAAMMRKTMRNDKPKMVEGLTPWAACCCWYDMPLQAKTIEVVHQRSAHEGLQCLVHIAQGDLLGQHLRLVHGHTYLGNSEESRRHDTGQFGALLGRSHEDFRVLGQEVGTATGPVFENERESSGGAHARNCRWRERECNA